MKEYQLPEYDATLISDDKDLSDYFESTAKQNSSFKQISNWLIGPVKSYLNDTSITIDQLVLQPLTLAALIDLVEEGKSGSYCSLTKIVPALISTPGVAPLQLAQQLNLDPGA